jgi:hypothetical protein
MFFDRYKWLTVALIVVPAFAMILGGWSRWLGAAPLDAPLTMSPPGRIETDVRVRLACPHRLVLHLSSHTHTREEMNRLVGRYGTAEGGEIPLRWAFRDTTGRVVVSGEAQNKGSYSHDEIGFYRAVSGWLPLPPGRYRLDAALTGDVAGFEGVSAKMYFQCHYNSSAGWHDDMLFYGGLAQVLAWPLAAGMALLLMALAIWEWWHARAASRSGDKSAEADFR